MFNIRRHNILSRQRTALDTCCQTMGKTGNGNLPLNILKASIRTDRTCSLRHQFHAIVISRIMASSNHDSTISMKMGSSKINHLRTALSDVNNRDTCGSQTIAQGVEELSASQADIIT